VSGSIRGTVRAARDMASAMRRVSQARDAAGQPSGRSG
jgi:hypothetical protein